MDRTWVAGRCEWRITRFQPNAFLELWVPLRYCGGVEFGVFPFGLWRCVGGGFGLEPGKLQLGVWRSAGGGAGWPGTWSMAMATMRWGKQPLNLNLNVFCLYKTSKL